MIDGFVKMISPAIQQSTLLRWTSSAAVLAIHKLSVQLFLRIRQSGYHSNGF
jgi:hypothetical protein